MHILSSILLLLLVVCFSTNCSPPKDIRFAEVVALRRSSPGFSLQVTPFLEQPPLPTLATKKMVFVTGAQLRQHLIAQTAVVSSSFGELWLTLDTSMEHQPFKLDIATDDGVARGRSFESVLALSAYSHFEHIFSFARSVNATLDFKRPLTVAIYGEILSPSGQEHVFSKNDNALYVGSADTVFLLPLGKEGGLPLTMHEGVLAHEFHHRIFFNAVWNNPGYKNLWSIFQSRYQRSRLDDRSRTLLNALDEGLADLFAVAFTGLPDYLSMSLTQTSSLGLRKQRDLNGAFAHVVTFDMLATDGLPTTFIELCGAEAKNFENAQFNVYCLGTVIAKTLFQTARSDNAVLRHDVLPLIELALNAVAAHLDAGNQFSLDIFFEALARLTEVQSKQLHQRFCNEVQQRFLSLATIARIPSCKEFFSS